MIDPKRQSTGPTSTIAQYYKDKLRWVLWFAALFLPLNYILGHGQNLPKLERLALGAVVLAVVFTVDWLRGPRRNPD